MNTKKIKLWDHKYIGYHNTKIVVSVSGKDKVSTEYKCKKLLLDYFHGLQDNITKYPLEYYNGVVAYVGEKID
nr:hypothetical protein [uncultured Mediterranean phage uvMED]